MMLWSNAWLGTLLIGSLATAAPSEPESGQRGKSNSVDSTSTSAPTSSHSSTTGSSSSQTSNTVLSTKSSSPTAGSNLQGLSASHNLSTGAVGGIAAAAIAGTAILILGTFLLYRRRVHNNRIRELDLISKDEQRSVGRDSPAAAIDPFASSSNGSNSGYPNVNPYDGVTVPVPSSPAMSYAPDVAPLSLTFSHVPSSIYDNPMTPTSLKSDLPIAGPSDKASIAQSTPAVREETDQLVQEKDGGISLMSSEDGSLRQAVPPAYSDRYNESEPQPSTSRSPFE